MKSLRIPLFVILSLLFIGCSSDDDDGGTNGTTPPPAVVRVIVDTLTTAPLMNSVDEATWNNVDSTLITIGGNAALYGKNSTIGNQNIPIKAIINTDTLYIKVSWYDAGGADTLANQYRKMSSPNNWDHRTTFGQDMFFLIFDAQDNGTEGANCATMCHSTGMKTTGGGHADAWRWMSAISPYAFLAEDLWASASSTIGDALINDYFYRYNGINSATAPDSMHEDTINQVSVLYLSEAITFRNDAVLNPFGYSWPEGFIMPGYIIDSSIWQATTRNDNSRNNVRSISSFESGTNIWTVVFSRALNTGKADDVDFSALDSVQVTLAATDDHPAVVYYPATKPPHSGSAPFWLILKP